MFADHVYAQRRSLLAQSLVASTGQEGVILLLGHEDVPYTFASNPYPFRQDSSVLYYLGIKQPGIAALIDLSNGDTDLVCNEQDAEELVWFTRSTPEDLQARSGAQRTLSHAALATRLQALQQRGAPVHYLPPIRESQTQHLQRLLGRSGAHVPSDTLIRCVVRQREIKSADELAEMESAVAIGMRMHEAARQYAVAGASEQSVVNAMNAVVAVAGVRMAYSPICTRDGQILHHLSHGNVLQRGDLLLIDAGIEMPSGYASDITRTHCIGDDWNDAQRLMRDAAQSAQQACAAAAQPDVSMASLHRLAARHLIEGLAPLGLFRGSTEAVLESGAYGLIFPHGLGHLIGLDVHDMESLGEDAVGYDDTCHRDTRFGPNHLRLGKRLREGMTITLEPGIYFIPSLWKRWRETGTHKDLIDARIVEHAMGLGGLRLEDDFVVHADGARKLG